MKRLATAAALGALALTAIPAEAGDKAKTEVSLVAIVPIGMTTATRARSSPRRSVPTSAR